MPIHAMSPAARRKAAGYARVSTNEEEQQSSYEAQVDYYTKMIQANPEWEFVGVFADEGISGTSTKKREQFNQMVDAALAGDIQLIITNAVITKGQLYVGQKRPCTVVWSLYF
jgi:predicted site-specific integrase-resolvase